MSLYLSRLLLNPHSRQVLSELAQPYEMHRTLMRAFPEASASFGSSMREKSEVLFRADVDDDSGRAVVYVQSKVEPDWSCLDNFRDYLLPGSSPPNPAWKEVSAPYQRLQDGQVLSFRLRANPTKHIAKALQGDLELVGKRVGLLREEDQIAWLIRKGHEREKGEPGGFEILMKVVEDRDGTTRLVPRVTVRNEGKQRGRKMEDAHPHTMTHLAVRFDGVLRITDADAFRNTLFRGIGPAKAFGFGLLSVAPCR